MISVKMLFIANTTILFLLSLYMLLRYKENSHNRAFRLVSYFVVSYFVGFVLLVLRNQIPNFLSIVVANTLFATCSLNLYVATKTILGLDSRWHYRYYIPILLIFIGFAIFTYIDFNTPFRMIIYFTFALIYSFLSFYLFWFYSSEHFKLFDKISAALFFIGIFNASFMVLRVFLGNVTSYYFGNIDIFMYLPNINMLFLSLWIVFLIKYRIKN